MSSNDKPEESSEESKQLIPIKTVKDFTKMIKGHCKVCAHPDRLEWEDKLVKHKTTQKDAGNAMNVSDQMVSEHMRFHFGQVVAAQVFQSPVVEATVENIEGAVAMLNGYLTKLTKRGNEIMDLPVDAKSEFAIKAHVSEVRELLKVIMEFSGNIQQTPSVKIHELNIQYDSFRNKIMDILCPSCRQKVADSL